MRRLLSLPLWWTIRCADRAGDGVRGGRPHRANGLRPRRGRVAGVLEPRSEPMAGDSDSRPRTTLGSARPCVADEPPTEVETLSAALVQAESPANVAAPSCSRARMAA